MAGKLLDGEAYTCPICLDLLLDPVAISCGHSFCMKCLQNHWDQQETCQCPECRESFSSRPVLTKNIMLAGLVEKLKETEPNSDLFPGPQDVTCDMCTGRKLKAVRSCLHCLVSFCDSHLQPHRHVAMLQKHQLVAPSNTLQENICHEHDKLKEIFCRTDQKLICYLCCIDQHKGHDVVSSATERAHREVQVEAEKGLLKNRVDHKEADLQKLQQEDGDIRLSAQRAVQHSVDIFKEVALLLEEKRSEVEQQIRTEEQSQLGRVQEVQDQLQQDLTELRRSISELEELSQTPDHNQFILRCPPVSTGSQRTGASASTGNNRGYFEGVTRALSALGDKLKISLTEFKLTDPKKKYKIKGDNALKIDLDLPEPSFDLEVKRANDRVSGSKDVQHSERVLWNEHRMLESVRPAKHRPDTRCADVPSNAACFRQVQRNTEGDIYLPEHSLFKTARKKSNKKVSSSQDSF